MLSLEKCRELLGNPSVSDDEVEVLRNALYESAQLAFEAYQYEIKSGSKNPVGLLRSYNPEDMV